MNPKTPHTVEDFIQLSGPLFEEVQKSGLFPDSKTFVDSVPKSDPGEIMNHYRKLRSRPHFNLKAFVYEHFRIPGNNAADSFEPAASMEEHIERLWDYLGRQADRDVSPHSSLIPLPHPYIVPGGRFREIYYWDTYFTAEGLAASGRMEAVENLARNFAWLIENFGHVPNGNRYYYLSRSQPPFFVMLLDLLARYKGVDAIREYLPALKQEYRYWMDGYEQVEEGSAHRRLANIDGCLLNRYWDDRPLPREESWREDRELAEGEAEERYRHLRAGAESGWDYSSRWFRDLETMETIRTADLLPVDLNALMYLLESKLAEWTEGSESARYAEAAAQRREAFGRFFWNASEGYYFDYDRTERKQAAAWSLAGAYPLFAGLTGEEQAGSVARILEAKFLEGGGLVSTLHQTGQQWDRPNGWAPLQWIAVQGLLKYGREDLARTIAKRWLGLNRSVFQRTGKMMEKYNVCDLSLEAGGGEYPLQDGFGWTNGVAVALKKLFPDI